MKGIFYCASVPSIGLLQEIIPVSQALSEEQIEAPLNSAYDMFIRPLLGDTLSDHFLDFAKRIADEDYVTDQVLGKVVTLLRRATANLAFWYSFTELNTHITDQGFQRSEGETYKPIYRYQELELKQQFRNKGFNAVDELLRYLQELYRGGIIKEYAKAPAFIDMQHCLVKGPAEIDRYYYVHGSYMVFLKLRPSFLRILDIVIEPAIGSAVCDKLRNYLDEENHDIEEDISQEEMRERAEENLRMEALRERVAAVVICKALAEHVRNIGSITDRGLYYTNIQAGQKESQNENQASDGERARQAANLQDTADHYLHRLIRWVETNMPEQFKGHPEDAYNRDNDHKHTFWA